MSVKVTAWVWDSSQSVGNDRLVLLAIADNANTERGEAWPSVPYLAEKTKLSTRTVQRCIASLVELGELVVTPNAGPHGTNLYRVTPVSPRQSVTPDKLAPEGVTPVSHEPTTKPTTTEVLRTSAQAETNNQRINRLSRTYTDRVKLCNFLAVRGVVAKAAKAGYDDAVICAALSELADEGRSVTTDTLRYAIEGFPANRQPARRTGGATQKAFDWMTVGTDDERLAAQ